MVFTLPAPLIYILATMLLTGFVVVSLNYPSKAERPCLDGWTYLKDGDICVKGQYYYR